MNLTIKKERSQKKKDKQARKRQEENTDVTQTTRLLQACEEAGFWKLVSRVFVENVASRGLLRSLDFREVGVYEKHGQLDGVWRDVVIVEYVLSRRTCGIRG